MKPKTCQKPDCGISREEYEKMELEQEWELTRSKSLYLCPLCINNTVAQDLKELRFIHEHRTYVGSPTGLFADLECGAAISGENRVKMMRNAAEMGLVKDRETLKREGFHFLRGKENYDGSQ